MKLILVLAAALAAGTSQDVITKKAATALPDDNAVIVSEQLPSYPTKLCLVSGEELGSMGDPIEHVADGKLVRLCCKGCVKKVDADPAAYVAKVNDAVIRAEKASYPLETCPLSGEKLDENAVDQVVGTRLVRVCCKRCAGAVSKDATKAMAAINTAYIAAQRPNYATKACIVSGEELDDDAVDVLYGTRLVRLCCNGCKKELAKNPTAVLAKLDAVAKKDAKSVKKVEKREGGR